MELTEKNGHASIEEILASVRRIIAEEPGANGQLIDLEIAAPHHPRGDGLLDDPSDFDLPSMFKTPVPSTAPEKPAPLFGRLSEAIRAASNGNGQAADPARAEQSLSALKLQRADGAEKGSASSFLLSTFHETTAPRAGELVAAATPDTASTPSFATGPAMSAPDVGRSPATTSSAFEPGEPVAAAPPPAAPQVPRQMAAFKDTRFRSMGSSPTVTEPVQPFVSPFEAAATAALVSAADAVPAPAPAPEPNEPILATLAEDLVAVEAPSGLTAAIVASYPSLAAEPVAAEPPVHVPPPVPAATPVATQAAAPIEDSTADLLRPMLRQWLAENMPRMVEKALHIEVAESVKSNKK